MSDNDWPPFTNPSDSLRDQMSPGSVGIVIPMRNQLRVFKMALFSVLGFTDHPYSLAVVDNMSDLTVKKALRDLSVRHRFHVLRHDNEFNFAAEVNLGLRFLFQNRKIEYGLILNADAVVEPLWLTRMLISFGTKFYGFDPVGVTGPLSDVAIPEQEGKRMNCISIAPRMVSGFCMMFRRDVFESIGGFDESFKLGGYEDWDFCHRAKKAGWSLTVNQSVHIKHFWRTSRREDKYHVGMARNKARFFEKHPELQK